MFGWFSAEAAARFAPKALQRLQVFRHVFRKELQGDVATEAQVLGFVDHTHATAAELLEDAVVGDGLADECVRARHSAAILGADCRQVNESTAR